MQVKQDSVVLEYFSANNLRVIKFDNYTATIMKSGLYVNITGLKSVYHMLRSLKLLSEITNVALSDIHYKIDSISALFVAKPGLRSQLQLLTKHNFKIEVKVRFTGVTVRHSYLQKAVCIYFQSGKCVLVGCKTFDHVKNCCNFMTVFLNTL